MLNLLADTFVFGNDNFGLSVDAHNPYLSVFGFQIYLYALCIVTGMCLAILIGGIYFKKRGYDPYDITIYALVIIPIGVLGARAYVYIFPWNDRTVIDWSTYFDFRSGGLGIYGGVIMGFLAAMAVAKIKKQDFRIVCDAIMPGLFLAQSLGRWGNFFNQEAHGAFITADYNALPNFFEWISGGARHGFNGYAVWIDANHVSALKGEVAGWYQATFFYESFCTLLGFILCVAVLTRSKRYKLGWCSAFYGIFYGAVRLVIESMRTDSLYLFVGNTATDIKISQLVSIFAIIFGVWTLTKIYRKELHALYKKLFKNDLDEISKSRWILLSIAIALFSVSAVMFVLCGVTKSTQEVGGESYLVAGVVLLAVAIYAGLGVWSLFDRMKVYNAETGERVIEPEFWQTEREKTFTAAICYVIVIGILCIFGLFSLIKWGIVDKIPNGTVLFVAAYGCAVAIALVKFIPTLKQLHALGKTNHSDNQSDSLTDDSISDQGAKSFKTDEPSQHVVSIEQSDNNVISTEGRSPERRNLGEAALSETDLNSVNQTAEVTTVCHSERSAAESKNLRTNVALNKFLLFVFPPKTYLDYGVENLVPYVDEQAEAKKAAKKAKRQSK